MSDCISRDVVKMHNPNKKMYILINSLTGRNVKITEECLGIIDTYVEGKYEKNEFLSFFEADDDREYFDGLIDILRENDILIDSESREIYEVDTITIEITHRCNLSCKHCSASAATLQCEEYLSTYQWMQILKQVAEMNPKVIVFSGGEPLVREDFWKLIEYVDTICNSTLVLMTNGLRISEENIANISMYFDQVDISVDGIDEETCSIVRGQGVFNKVLTSVHLLKNYGMRVSLSMVDTKVTHRYIYDFKAMCSDLEVYPIIRSFEPIGRASINKDLFLMTDVNNNEKLYDLISELDRPIALGKGFSCGAGRNKFSIDAKGDLYPCSPLEIKDYKITSLLNCYEDRDDVQNSIKNGWRKLHELMPYNICDGCEFNMFCWECLHDVYLAKRNPEYFKSRCEFKRREFVKLWE